MTAPGPATSGIADLDRTLGGLLLVVPVYFTFECEPAVLDLRLNAVLRHGDVPLEGVDGGVSEVGVRPRRARRKFNREIVFDCLPRVKYIDYKDF